MELQGVRYSAAAWVIITLQDVNDIILQFEKNGRPASFLYSIRREVERYPDKKARVCLEVWQLLIIQQVCEDKWFKETLSHIDACTEALNNPRNFIADCVRTESRDFGAIGGRLQEPKIIRLLHAAMGKVTEAGEIMDALKKHIYYGKPLDEVNIKEEIGDSRWYDSIALDVLGISDDEVEKTVIAKLRKRYPGEVFSGDKAINRDLAAERKVLEGK